MQGAGGVARVLHLIDPLSPWAGPCALRLLADLIASQRTDDGEAGADSGVCHDVLIIGRDAETRLARTCSVPALGSIWPRGGRVLGAVGAMRRWLTAARRNESAPNVIHAWSAGCGALAALAAPNLPRVVTSRQAAVEVGSRHFIPRQVVRDRWQRDEGVQSDEFVIGLLGEHVERFDARRAMHVGARTGLSSRRIRLVMSGRSLGRPAAHRFLAALDLDRSIVQDEGVAQPWQVLSGLDAALLLAPVSSGGRALGASEADLSALPMLWAWAAGVPVIAEASAPSHSLLEPGHNGLIFPAGDLNSGCDRVARLHDDAAFAARLADAGRVLVQQRFSMSRFRERVFGAYRKAALERRTAYLDVEHEARPATAQASSGGASDLTSRDLGVQSVLS